MRGDIEQKNGAGEPGGGRRAGEGCESRKQKRGKGMQGMGGSSIRGRVEEEGIKRGGVEIESLLIFRTTLAYSLMVAFLQLLHSFPLESETHRWCFSRNKSAA